MLSYPLHKSEHHPVKCMAMVNYLMYKNKINDIRSSKLLPTLSITMRVKLGWHQDVKYWLNHWGI